MTSDRKFFSGMALAALLTVVAGFAPSYFFKSHFGGPQLAPLLHVHGALFTAWMVLFLAQALLVTARRTDLHRRLGVAGFLLAVASKGCFKNPTEFAAADRTCASGNGL